MVMPRQLPLNIRLRDEATFDNFWVGESTANVSLVAALRALAGPGTGEPFLYLWGRTGSGRSHLLQAACHGAREQGLQSQYLPLAELAEAEPAALLEGLEEVDLLCLDDLQQVLGQRPWDEALFHLYNRLRERQGRLVLAAGSAPRELPLQVLADLRSRLAATAVYRVQPLDDGEKALALQWRARRRGLEMSDEVALYILQRGSREPRDLFDCLEQLDRLSLAEKRRLTIPFVRAALEA